MKFSIIIPCYNKDQYIEECVNSCLAQTYKDLEIIVIDNESTDTSWLKILALKNLHGDRLKTDFAANIYPRCWDECVDLARQKYVTGDYYTIIGADDAITTDYIQNCVNYIQRTKSPIFQSVLTWFRDGQVINRVHHQYTNLEQFKQKLLIGSFVNTPSVCYKTGFLEELGVKGDPAKYSGACDYDLWCQIADKGVMIDTCSDFLGYYYRLNPGQATWQMQASPISYDKLIQKKWSNKWTKN